MSKNNKWEIDEEAIIESFVHSGWGEKKEVSSSVNEPKEVNARKKKGVEKYIQAYLKKKSFHERHSVYISAEKHKTISYILKMYGDRDMTIGRYIDNILEAHLDMYKDDLIRLIQDKKNENEKDLFSYLSKKD